MSEPEVIIRETVFKGATRPPMKWGVPLIALVLLFMPAVIVTLWLTIGGIFLFGKVALLVVPVCMVLIGIAFAWMRWMTSRDDQRLTQWFKRFRLNGLNRNRLLFGNRSYGAYRAKGASNEWRR